MTAAVGSPGKRPCKRRPCMTAPAVQEECDYQRSVRVQPFIRAYECSRFENCTQRGGTRPWPDAASLKDGQSLFLRYDTFEIGLLTVDTVTAGHRRAGDAELLQRCCDLIDIRRDFNSCTII